MGSQGETALALDVTRFFPIACDYDHDYDYSYDSGYSNAYGYCHCSY